MSCAVEECGRAAYALGWCEMHYARVRRSGAPGPAAPTAQPTDLERFLAKTERDPVSGCLLWTAGKFSNGYGAFQVQRKTWKAHRWAFYHFYDELPEVVMHRCDTPACVDWERCLRAGTPALNMLDRDRKQRNARGERHGSTKVTDAQCAQIASDVAAGEFQYVVATRFGISNQQVSNIVRGARRESYGSRR